MKKIFTLLVAILATTCLWAQRFQVGDLYYKTADGMLPIVVDTIGWNIPAECLTVAQAREICAKLESGATTGTKYYVKGWVKKLHSKNADGIATYGSAQFYMEDVKDANSQDDFIAYQVYGLNSEKITNPDAVVVGDYVVIYGELTNYNGTYETVGKGAAYIWNSTNPALGTPGTGGGDDNQGGDENQSTDVVGDGTAANPYTANDVLLLANGKTGNYYVKAYIVGQVNAVSMSSGAEFNAPFSSSTNQSTGELTGYNTNLLLANTADETNPDNCVPLQLPSGALRTGLNLVQHPEMDGQEILVYGSFEKYFGTAGIKSSSYAKVGDKEFGTNPDGSGNDNTPTDALLSETLLSQESFDKFTAISVKGDQVWTYDEKYGAKMSGYNGSGTDANEDWFLTPALDLTGKSSVTLTFDHAFGPAYAMPDTDAKKAQYTLWICNDYNGDGNVAAASWKELKGMAYGTEAWGYITSGEITIPAENLTSNCRIAWKYVCNDVSATWEVKNVVIKEDASTTYANQAQQTSAVLLSDEKHYVVVTYDKQWSSDNYSYLTTAVIPETIEYMGTTYDVVGIEEGAFAYSPITSVTIPNSIEYIEHGAFSDCYNLTSTFHSGDLASWCDINFQDWGANPTQYSHKLYLNIPGTSYAEEVKGDIVLPNTVDTIPNYAFYGCSGLTSVTIPNSVTSIGNYAFYECTGLTSITIPNSITSIGNYAFSGCSSLTSIAIPNSITSIGYNAFASCSALEYLSIPNSVQYAYEDDYNNEVYYLDGYSSIYGCYNLKTLIVPADFFAPEYDYDYPFAVEEYLPYLPEKLESLTINGGNMDHRFGWDFINRNRKSLKHIDFAATESIEEEAFTNFYNLESLVLPSQLETVPYMAVAECVKLKSISIPATVTAIEDRSFENCRMLSSVAFAENGALTRIGNWAFYNCHELQQISIPEGVTEIGKAAFFNCTYLKELTLPASMQSVADNGFALCEKLEQMNVKAAIPPVAEARTFENVNRNIPVFVPTESVAAYKSAPVWQEFNIQGKDPVMSDVENIGSDNGYGVMDNGKIMRNGQLIIIRDGIEYNTLGQAL